MRRTITGLCLLLSILAMPAAANGIHPDGYTIYQGDINGDGVTDLYFHYQAPIVILHGEIATPIRMPQLPNFVMYGKIEATPPPYGIPFAARYDDPVERALNPSEMAALTPLSTDRIKPGDFNGDRAGDLLVFATSPSAQTFSQYIPLILLADGNGLPIAGQQFATNISFAGDYSYLSVYERALASAAPANVSVRDVTGNGRADIVIAGGSGDAPIMLAASSGGSFSQDPVVIAPQVANMAGASGGQFRVDESGAATYSIAIATAAGTAGVVPEVSLNYSGNGGNGLVGAGWSIGGLSGVSRCRQTLGVDGKLAPITFSKDDRFCLDGQRLLLATGSGYGAVGATYKTEMDSFAKISSVGGSLGKPDYFTVERKDGSISFYGNTPESKQLAGSHTLAWMQNRFEDSVGNHIEYNYEGSATTGHRIKNIRYAFGGGSHGAEISFTYTTRPDSIRGYTGGFEFRTTRRLSKITSRSSGNVIREYTLGYQPVAYEDYPDKTSLLANIQECVGSSCLPAISFDWLQPRLTYPTAGVDAFTFADDKKRTYIQHQYADISGNGKQDLIWLEHRAGGSKTMRIQYAVAVGDKWVKKGFRGTRFNGEYISEVNSEKGVRFQVLDYNGDGRQDLAIWDANPDASGIVKERWYIYLSKYDTVTREWVLSSDGINTGLSDKNAIFADFNGDGLADYISVAGGQVKVRLLEKAGVSTSSDRYYRFSSTENSYALSVPGATMGNPEVRVPKTLGDFNGDGAMDLLVATYSDRWGCRPTGGGGDQPPIIEPFLPRQLQGGPGSCGPNETWDYLGTDYDGHRVAYFDMASNSFKSMGLLSGSKVDRDPIAIDINDDGLTDLAYVVGSTLKVLLSTGTGFVEVSSYANLEKASFADINNNGYPDLVWPDYGDGYLKVRYFNPASSNYAGTVHKLRNIGTNDENHYWFADVDGDGQPDFHKLGRHNNGYRLTTYLANKDVPADRNKPRNVIHKIDNGLGNLTDITYANMVGGGVYTRLEMSTSTQQQCYTEPPEPDGNGGTIGGGTFCYPVTVGDPASLYSALNGPWDLPAGSHTIGKDKPVLDVLAPTFLVKKVESSAPAAGANPGSINHNAKSSVSYHYHQMKLQAAGRGMLGFQKISSTDNQTGVITETTYRQDFPFIGMPLNTEVRTASGKVLSRAANTWKLQNWNSGNPPAPYQPFIAKAVEETRDLKDNGASQGSLLQTVVTDSTYDQYGNALTLKVTTTDAASGDRFIKNTVNTYGTSTWEKEKGRLATSRVTNTRPGMSNHVRESAFTYYTSGTRRGLLKTEVIEPNKSAYTTTTEYEYDNFGNVTKKTLSASGEASRFTRTEYDDARRYATKVYNALGHLTEEVVSRNHFGAPLEVKGMNGLRSYFTYDALGREVYTWNNAGADKRTLYEGCASGCVSGAKYKVTTSNNTGAWNREYYDVLGRVMRTETQGFSKTIYTDREYDNLGRLRFASEPWFSGDGKHWTRTEYDLLGRPTKIIAPDNSQATVAYNGLIVVTTNDKGQKKTEIKNVAGELVEVKDAINGRLTYEYDRQGNLHKVNSHGNGDISGGPITVTVNYDDLGRKTSMSDPDKGSWTYTYTKYGELKKQTNANGHTVEFTYDLLGRQKTRVDKQNGSTIRGNVTWTYDSAANGLGQVEMIEDSISGYLALFQYDQLGRNDTQLVSFDGTGPSYVTTTQFDSRGRVEYVYDALDDRISGRSGTRNHYNSRGYLEKITDLATGDLIQQTLDHTARGQLRRQLLGNGATSTFSYQASTGRLLQQTSTVLDVFGIQRIDYEWDTLGNLISRENRSGAKSGNPVRESFCYDSLNRLIKTHIGASNYNCAGLTSGNQDIRYNSVGNITYKAGVGNYSYGQNNAGPHAVTTAGSATYQYDTNGNMIADTFDGGRSISYTTFDMAELITKGTHSTQFKYGPDRSRYYRKDTSSGQTTETWYIGNIERIVKSSAPGEIQWKRHLAGTALYTVKTDLNHVVQSTEKLFLYKDHLGSMDLITTKSASVVEELSFDAWGQRRNAQNWNSLTLAQLYGFDTSRTTRGYTGHEMVDAVGLIHMNGRIYDARIGRFLQADPFVQAAGDTQMYNRYSYLRNNPLNATDPSGYFLKKLWKEIKPYIGAIVAIAVTVFCPACGPIVAGMIGGGLSAAINGGNILQGIAFGALSGFAGGFGGITGFAGRGLVGGLQSRMAGGKFGHGFWAAGIGGAAGGQGFSPIGFFGSAVLGGVATRITGGKFKNGAAGAAFMYVMSMGASKVAQKFQPKVPQISLPEDLFEIQVSMEVDSSVSPPKYNFDFDPAEWEIPTLFPKEAPETNMSVPGYNSGTLSEGWGVPDFSSPNANVGVLGEDLLMGGWNQSQVSSAHNAVLGVIAVPLTIVGGGMGVGVGLSTQVGRAAVYRALMGVSEVQGIPGIAVQGAGADLLTGAAMAGSVVRSAVIPRVIVPATAATYMINQ